MHLLGQLPGRDLVVFLQQVQQLAVDLVERTEFGHGGAGMEWQPKSVTASAAKFNCQRLIYAYSSLDGLSRAGKVKKNRKRRHNDAALIHSVAALVAPIYPQEESHAVHYKNASVGSRHRAVRRFCPGAGNGGQAWPRGADVGRTGPLRPRQCQWRDPGSRRPQRQGLHDRRQEGEIRAAERRRRGRPQAGHGGCAEAGRRQGQRRDRPPQFRHHDPRIAHLPRRRHPADLAVGHQSEVHPAGLQVGLPRRRQRRPAGRHAGQVCGHHAQGQEHRRHRRPHRLRPGRRRPSSSRAPRPRCRACRSRSSTPPTRQPTSMPS